MAMLGYLVPTSGYANKELARRRNLLLEKVPADVDIGFLSSEHSPEFLDEGHHFGEAISQAGRLLTSTEATEFDVLILGGALDPGLKEARTMSPIPLIGPGEVSMFLASIANVNLSIVTVDEHAVAAAYSMLDNLHYRPDVVSVRSMQLPVRSIMDDFDAASEALMVECRAAKDQDRASAIYLGAMILGMLPVSSRLRESIGLPIFNPVDAAVAAGVAILKANG